MECEPFHFDRHVLEARQLPTYSNIRVCMKCAVLQMNLNVCLVLGTPHLAHQRCYSMIVCHFTFHVVDVLLQECWPGQWCRWFLLSQRDRGFSRSILIKFSAVLQWYGCLNPDLLHSIPEKNHNSWVNLMTDWG